tara:strand:- start:1237 stop:2574 length:1338 start_codon:yes stop_codon:yes gene_type:complete
MASTYLTFTQQTPSTAEAQKFTLSMWVKKCGQGLEQGLYGNTYSNTHRGYIYFDASDRLAFFDSSGTNIKLSRKFRDTNAWYHIVFAVDTTQSSDADKIKIYINGELYAGSYSSNTYPNNNQDLKIMNTTNTPYMGRYVEAGTSYYFRGALSHVHFTQGYVYQASDFGETDTTTGEWKIKTSPSISNYGTNGFWWLKDSIATTDHSPNSNAFSVGGGTLTKTEDCPSNVFATLNPLINIGSNTTYSQGNNTVSTDNANYKVSPSTLAVSSGKWYMEFKAVSGSFGSIDAAVGIVQADTYFSTGSKNLNAYTNGYSYGSLGKVREYNASDVYTASTYADGDIIGIALDMDNNKLYFHKNGTYQNSGVPTSGSTGTGAVSITSGKQYYFACSTIASGGTKVFSANFGNGYFGTTAVSSAGTNASNNGIFEYDVPAGYTALSTKGLNL